MEIGRLNKLNYRPDVDGLRALAIFAVILFHAFPQSLTGGFIGVDIFFVISGYLITRILLNDLRQGEYSIAEFYRRRIRRIFPALGLVCLTSLASGWFLLFSGEYTSLSEQVAAGATFLSNFLHWQQNGYFDQAAETKPLLHLWSLAVEEQFYIVWPFLLSFAWRRGWNIRKTIACIGLISFIANGALLLTGNANADFYSPWARIWELAAGGILATQQRTPIFSRWGNLKSLAGFTLAIVSMFFLDSKMFFPGLWALAPIAAACLILNAGSGAWFNRAVLSHRVMVWFGLISFPLYLWHWPTLVFARLLFGAPLSGWAATTVLLISVLLAWLTFNFIEKEMRHVAGRTAAPVLLSAFTALVFMSVMVYLESGYPDRPIRQKALWVDEVALKNSKISDGSCLRLLGQAHSDSVVCRSNSAAPRIMIVGDSHAMAMYSAIVDDAKDTTAMLMAWFSCPLYPNLQYTPPHGKSDQKFCADMARSALAMAEALPSIEQVIMVNYAYDVDETKSAYSLSDKTLTKAEAFEYGTEYMAQSLLQSGKRPIVLLDVPHLRLAPNACVSRFSFLPDRPECTLGLREHENLRKKYRAVISNVSVRNPGLVVYDAASVFCKDGNCQYRIGQEALYYDNHHLSPLGAKQLLHRMQADGILD